jgi:hypothetical protein
VRLEDGEMHQHVAVMRIIGDREAEAARHVEPLDDARDGHAFAWNGPVAALVVVLIVLRLAAHPKPVAFAQCYRARASAAIRSLASL